MFALWLYSPSNYQWLHVGWALIGLSAEMATALAKHFNTVVAVNENGRFALYSDKGRA